MPSTSVTAVLETVIVVLVVVLVFQVRRFARGLLSLVEDEFGGSPLQRQRLAQPLRPPAARHSTVSGA